VEGCLTLEEECLDVHVPLTYSSTRSKRTVRAPSSSRVLNRKRISVRIGTITHGLAIWRKHVAVLTARLFGARSHTYTVRTDNTPKVRFSATLGEEPEVEVE
jgi:hypothetical protein